MLRGERHSEPAADNEIRFGRQRSNHAHDGPNLYHDNQKDKTETGNVIIGLVTHPDQHADDPRAVQRWDGKQVEKTEQQAQIRGL